MRVLVIAALIVWAAGCSRQGREMPARSPEGPAPAPAGEPERGLEREAGRGLERGLGPPFVMELEGVGQAEAGQVVEAEIVLRLHGPLRAPLHLKVRPGPGIRLVEGRSDETIPTSEAQQEIRRKLLLLVDDPAGAVEVLAVMRGEGFGATARKSLTFDGRPPSDGSPRGSRGADDLLVEPRPKPRDTQPRPSFPPPGLPVPMGGAAR